MHDGPGPLTVGPIYDDPLVPGRRISLLRVSDAEVDQLRQELVGLLGSPSQHDYPQHGGERNFLRLLVNPTQSVAGCAAGVDSACLSPWEWSSRTALFAWDGVRPETDPRWVIAGPVFSDASLDALNVSVPMALPTSQRDVAMLFQVHPEQLAVKGGLTMPAALTLAPAMRVDGTCALGGTGTGIIAGLDCDREIFGELNGAVSAGVTAFGAKLIGIGAAVVFGSPALGVAFMTAGAELVGSCSLGHCDCNFMNVEAEVRRLPLEFGFRPSSPAGCDPAHPDAVQAHRARRRRDLQNAPLGRAYDQPCLDVDPVLGLGQFSASIELSGDLGEMSGDMAASVELHGCAGLHVACAQLYELGWVASLVGEAVPTCDDLVESSTDPKLRAGMASALGGGFADQLDRYFAYDGAAFERVPAQGCKLSLASPDDCFQTAVADLLPGSLTRTVYGWFANPFGNGHPPGSLTRWEYPVTRVIAGSDESYMDFEYAVDPDGDGVVEEQDECPGMKNTGLDPDGDGVDSACDNCWNVWNAPGYDGDVATQADRDGDGLGDACDWDPDVESVNDPLVNCGFEAELAASFPEQLGDPVAGAADRFKYLVWFRDGTAESAPCGRMSMSAGRLSPVVQAGAIGPGVIASCLAAGYLTDCEPDVTNRIRVAADLPGEPEVAGFQHPARGTSGAVELRWCDCDGAHTEEGRRECRLASVQDRCLPVRTQFSMAQWKNVHVAPGVDPATGEWSVPPSADPFPVRFDDGAVQLDALWDFTRLGASCAVLPRPGGDPIRCDEPQGFPRVDGVLWSSLRGLPGLSEDTARSRGSHVAPGRAGFTLVRKSVSDFDRERWRQTVGDLVYDPCWVDGCPGLPGAPATRLTPWIYPPWVAGASSLADELRGVACRPTPDGCTFLPVDLGPTDLAGAVLAAWRDPTRLFVAPSEPVDVLAAKARGLPILRGVVLDRGTAGLLQIATQATLGAKTFVTDSGGALPCPGGDCLVAGARGLAPAEAAAGPAGVGDPEGVALSGSRGELFLFGGFQGLRPRDTAWSFTAAGWQAHPLPPGARPGDVLAAAYHLASDRYYEVDRLLLQARLRRWDAGVGRFTTLGRWPSAWHPFARHWLVAGREGDLYFVATRPAGTVIARLLLDPASGEVELGGLEFLEREVVGKPLGVAGGLLVVRQPAAGSGQRGPSRELLASSTFDARPPSWCPELGGG